MTFTDKLSSYDVLHTLSVVQANLKDQKSTQQRGIFVRFAWAHRNKKASQPRTTELDSRAVKDKWLVIFYGTSIKWKHDVSFFKSNMIAYIVHSNTLNHVIKATQGVVNLYLLPIFDWKMCENNQSLLDWVLQVSYQSWHVSLFYYAHHPWHGLSGAQLVVQNKRWFAQASPPALS